MNSRNNNNVYTLLGATNHSDFERQPVDYYATDPNAVEIFLEKLKEDKIILPNEIYEPACGGGHISEVLKKHGYTVHSSDLYKSDFLADCIFTNPPYKKALPFVRQAIKNVKNSCYVIMFLRIQFLEGKERYNFFKYNPPKYVYVNSSRQKCSRNADFENFNSSAVCFCWFIWEKGYHGETTVRWIA